jgi:hypothetical protein
VAKRRRAASGLCADRSLTTEDLYSLLPQALLASHGFATDPLREELPCSKP